MSVMVKIKIKRQIYHHWVSWEQTFNYGTTIAFMPSAYHWLMICGKWRYRLSLTLVQDHCKKL